MKVVLSHADVLYIQKDGRIVKMLENIVLLLVHCYMELDLVVQLLAAKCCSYFCFAWYFIQH